MHWKADRRLLARDSRFLAAISRKETEKDGRSCLG